jgi:glucose/arabinose dehydrogenase
VWIVGVGLLLAGLLLAACNGPDSQPSPDTRTAGSPSTTDSRLPVTEVLPGLTSPWGMIALKDGTLLISERDTKQILRIDGSRKEPLRTINEASPGGEGGLLGLAITPDESRVFAYYTGAEDNRIVAMTWDGRSLGQPELILDGIPKSAIHNGGRMVVGPDGYLYVGTGDGAESERAQDKSSLGGKILRVTVTGAPAPGNPFGNEVFSYGHRNVQGLAFDDQGRLWACEFGSNDWDELNLIEKGKNYGWPLVEGSGEGDGLTNPKVVWRTSEASPSGLAYWQGDLWMAGLRGERLWQIPLHGTETGDPVAHFQGQYGRLRTVVVSSDGRSLLMTGSNTDGRGDARKGDDRLLQVRSG